MYEVVAGFFEMIYDNHIRYLYNITIFNTDEMLQNEYTKP